MATEIAERREAWWRDWWAADYSWDGLAAKYSGWKLGADGYPEPYFADNDQNATLQDIWADVGLIPEWEDGEVIRQWTRAHLPMRFESGAPAKLAWGPDDWTLLEQEIETVIRRLLDHPRLGETDFLPLYGIILWRLPHQVTEGPGFNFKQSGFIGDNYGHASRFGGMLDFGQCLFDGSLDLTDSNFARRVSFEEAAFCESAWFHGVTFLDSVSFEGAFLGSEASFRAAQADRLNLSGIRVGELYADTVSIKDSIMLSRANIAGSVSLSDASVGSLWVYDSNVDGDFTAAGSTLERMRAERTVFSGTVDLAKIKVQTEADFSGAKFLKLLSAKGAKFDGKLIFDGAAFASAVDFSSTAMGEHIQFRSAQFEAPAWFNKSEWPAAGGFTQSCFLDANFKRLADFRSENPPRFSAFDGAILKAEVRFSRSAFVSDNSFRAQLSAARSDGDLEALENGCRALKISAEAFGDRLGGQRFYRYELMARRKRASTPRAERIASYAYQLTSDFGMSFSRPLLALVLSWFLFAGVYLAFASARFDPREVSVSALESSARAIFKPLGIWSVEVKEKSPCNLRDLDSAMINCTTSVMALIYRVLLTIQAFLSGILIFLFGLALKRRFQIS